MITLRRSGFLHMSPALLVAATLVGVSVRLTWAEVSIWEPKADGRCFSCPDGPTWCWPNNIRWEQSQIIGPSPCTGEDVIRQPSNWTTANYPNNNLDATYDVIIGAPAPTELGTGATINSLTLLSGGLLNMLSGTQLTIGGGLVNDTRFVMDSNQGNYAYTRLRFDADATLSGSGELIMQGQQETSILTGDGATVLHAAGHRIRGRGAIWAAMINQGDIIADAVGQTLTLAGPPKINSSLIQVTSGAVLDLSIVEVTQTGAGQLVADGGTVRVRGTSVTGGELISRNGGTIRLEAVSGNRLINTTVSGLLIVEPNAPPRIAGASLTNNGSILLDEGTGGACSGGTLTFETDGMTLQGSGTIDMECGARLVSDGNGPVITHAAGHTIRGQGHIAANLINHGLVRADSPGNPLIVGGFAGPSANTNHASLIATSGGLLDLTNTNIVQGPGGRIVADGGTVRLQGGTVQGGELAALNGSFILVDIGGSTRIVDMTLSGPLHIANGTLLAEGTALTNNANIVVNPTGGSSIPALTFNHTMDLTGTGEILLNKSGTGARIQTAAGATVTQTAGHTIHGIGRISAALVNNGLILADVPGQTLTLSTSPKTNNSIMKATGGAVLEIEEIQITQSPAARIVADGSTVQLRTPVSGTNPGVTGGTLAAEGAGRFIVAGNARLTDVTLAGPLDVPSIRTLEVAGNALTNDGTILLNSSGGSTAASVTLKNALTLQGSGELVLNAASAAMLNASTFLLTHGPDHTIRGTGQISGAFVNQGRIAADVAGQPLTLALLPGTLNSGTIEALAGGTVSMTNSQNFTNANRVVVHPAGALTVSNGYLQTEGATVVDGTMTLSNGTFGLQGGLLQGSGTVTRAVSNTGGQVQPGASPGVLNITGSYTQGPGGTLAIELGGPDAGDSDQLQVSSSAALEGTLAVSYVPGFIPQAGQEFTILTADSRSGQFSAISGPGQYQATYNPTSVVLTVIAPCQSVGPDLDDDCDVDADDLALFVSCASGPAIPHHGTPTCQESDLDADGDVDQSDFGKFQRCLTGENIPADSNCAN